MKMLMEEDADFAARYIEAEGEDQEFDMSLDQYTIVEEKKTQGWINVARNAPGIADLWNFLARSEYQTGGPARRKIKINEPSKPLDLYQKHAVTTKEKCNLLAARYASRGNAPTMSLSRDECKLLEKAEQPTPVTGAEVLRALKMMNKKRAPGRDKISTNALLELTSCHEELAKIYTKIIHGEKMPSEMLQVDIILLDKPGREGISAYRPISLIQATTKCL